MGFLEASTSGQGASTRSSKWASFPHVSHVTTPALQPARGAGRRPQRRDSRSPRAHRPCTPSHPPSQASDASLLVPVPHGRRLSRVTETPLVQVLAAHFSQRGGSQRRAQVGRSDASGKRRLGRSPAPDAASEATRHDPRAARRRQPCSTLAEELLELKGETRESEQKRAGSASSRSFCPENRAGRQLPRVPSVRTRPHPAP